MKALGLWAALQIGPGQKKRMLTMWQLLHPSWLSNQLSFCLIEWYKWDSWLVLVLRHQVTFISQPVKYDFITLFPGHKNDDHLTAVTLCPCCKTDGCNKGKSALYWYVWLQESEKHSRLFVKLNIHQWAGYGLLLHVCVTENKRSLICVYMLVLVEHGPHHS